MVDEPRVRHPGRSASVHRRIWPESQLEEANAARGLNFSSERSSDSEHLSKKHRSREKKPMREIRRDMETGRSSMEPSESPYPGHFQSTHGPRFQRGPRTGTNGEAEASSPPPLPAHNDSPTLPANRAGHRRPSHGWHSKSFDYADSLAIEGPAKAPPQNVGHVRSEPWRSTGGQASGAGRTDRHSAGAGSRRHEAVEAEQGTDSPATPVGAAEGASAGPGLAPHTRRRSFSLGLHSMWRRVRRSRKQTSSEAVEPAAAERRTESVPSSQRQARSQTH